MSFESMAKNLTDAYRLEKDGRFIAVANSFAEEVHPAIAETICQLVDDTIEAEEAEENDIDRKKEVG